MKVTTSFEKYKLNKSDKIERPINGNAGKEISPLNHSFISHGNDERKKKSDTKVTLLT